jgi:hypothetical protein
MDPAPHHGAPGAARRRNSPAGTRPVCAGHPRSWFHRSPAPSAGRWPVDDRAGRAAGDLLRPRRLAGRSARGRDHRSRSSDRAARRRRAPARRARHGSVSTAPPPARHPALRGDGARLRPAQPARSRHDGQHRRPAGLSRRRAGRRVAHPVGRGARAGATAGRSVRQLGPARRPGDRARVGPDGDVVADGPPADPSAGRAGGRPGGRLGALCPGGAAGLRTAGRRALGSAARGHLGRLAGRGAAGAADRGRPRLPPEHPVPAGAPARLPRGALSRHPAGRGVDRAGRDRDRPVR